MRNFLNLLTSSIPTSLLLAPTSSTSLSSFQSLPLFSPPPPLSLVPLTSDLSSSPLSSSVSPPPISSSPPSLSVSPPLSLSSSPSAALSPSSSLHLFFYVLFSTLLLSVLLVLGFFKH